MTTLLVLFLVKEQFTPEAGDAAGKPTGAGGWRLTWTTVLLPALPVLAIYGCNSLARLMDQSQIALYVEQLNGGVDFPGREMFTSWVMGPAHWGPSRRDSCSPGILTDAPQGLPRRWR